MTRAPHPAPAASSGTDADAAGRAARLEALLGDPTAAHNPAGHRALLLADHRAVPPADAEGVLDGFGLHEEFVPRALGGRFDSVEGLLRVLRPVWRRDIGLGTSHGLASFTAASHVWAAGTSAQRRRLAALLFDGQRAASAPRETPRASARPGGGVRAAPGRGGLRLTGSRPAVVNMPRAAALVLSCRTGEPRDSLGHSLLLLDPAALPPDRFRGERCAPGPGLRGVPLGDVHFDACPVPEESLLGPAGTGVSTALRSAHVGRTLLCGLALAAADTALRTAVLVSRGGTRPGRPGPAATDPRSAGRVLASAFADLLLYDCLTVTATRALHLRPAEAGLYAAALTSLLPTILMTAMYELTTVLGSEVFTRQGTVGVFQKHLRDLPAVVLAHAGTAAARATLLPQLPGSAAQPRPGDGEAPAALFRPHEPLPPFAYELLAPAGGRDSLSACLVETTTLTESDATGSPAERALATLARQLRTELGDLGEHVRAMTARDGAPRTGPAWLALTERYALVLAAAAVLGVWRYHRDGPDPFLTDPAWAAAALHRITLRLGTPGADLPAECRARLHQEVIARFTARRSYDLHHTRLAG